MKKVITLVLFFSILLSVTHTNAQKFTQVVEIAGEDYLADRSWTLEQYNAGSPRFLLKKTFIVDADIPGMTRAADSLFIYNEDFTLYRAFSTLDFNPNYGLIRICADLETQQQFYISRYFFNSDDKVEFVIYDREKDKTVVVNEDGEELCDFPGGLFYDSGTEKYIFETWGGDAGSRVWKVSDDANVTTTSAIARTAIFPNPAFKGDVTIVYNLEGQTSGILQVFDVTGKRVIEKTLSCNEQSIAIDISSFQSGTYIACISSNNKEIMNEKFIVK